MVIYLALNRIYGFAILSSVDTPKKLTLDSTLQNLLQGAEVARNVWREAERVLNQASDEAWVAQMHELDRLKAQYRAYQDDICHYLQQALKKPSA